MRVMQFLTVLTSGGTERQGVNLGVALTRRGHTVRFGCLNRTGGLLAELERAHIPVREYRLRTMYSPRVLLQGIRLARDLAREQVDVVHAYNFYGNTFAVPAARFAGVPLVIAGVRDVGVYLDRRKRFAQRLACRFADLILVNADEIRRWLISEGYAADRIEVIRNGIDLDRFDRAAAGSTSIRRELGIGPDVPLVSTIARLCPTKGFEDAIEAMAIVARARPDAHHIIAGQEMVSRNGELFPGWKYRAALEARARSLGIGDRVHFLGLREDVPAILRDVTVAVQPSLTEGLSNSVLEAMAAGRPVVATPVGGTPEVIRDGETGWLAPVRDPRAVASIVLRLLDEPAARARVGEAAARLVRDTLSVPAMARATEALYLDRLERKRRTGDARVRGVSAVSAR